MHGKNPTRGLETYSGFLQVHEIFPTIQGEGPLSGTPAIFIRLSGCNLRCHFCDTVWDDENDAWRSPEEIVENVLDLHRTNFWRHKETGATYQPLVVLTGGEPARQDCSELIGRLIQARFIVQIETAGTYWAPWMDQVVVVISPKTRHVNKKFYEEKYLDSIHWKYVIRAGEVDEGDGLPKLTTQQEDPNKVPVSQFLILQNKYGKPARPPEEAKNVWVSPCNEHNEELNRLNRMAVAESCMRFGYRAQVQLHVFLELP